MPGTEHSFGGSALDRYVFDFETVADAPAATAGDTAGAAPSGTDPAAAPSGAGAGETVPPAVVTEPAPAAPPMFDLNDPAIAAQLDGWLGAQLGQQLAPLLQYLEGAEGGAARAPVAGGQQFDLSQIDLDPFGDEFGPNIAQLISHSNQQLLEQVGQMIGQVAQPLNARIEAETTAEGDQRLKDMLADDISRNGDFPRAPGQTESKAEQLVRPLAEALFPTLVERFGNGPRTAEMAMNQAAATVRSIIAEAGAYAVEQHKNQLTTLAGVRSEPGAATSGAQTLPDGPQDARSLATKFGRQAEAIRAGNGAGV